MPEFPTYTLVVFAHIVSAIVLMGSGVVAPLIHRFVCDARTLDELRTWLDFGRRASKANPVMALVLLASGVYLGSFGWWSEVWFFVALAAWVLNSILAGAVVGRTAAALGKAAASGGDAPVPADVDARRRSHGWVLAHDVMLASDIAILWLMLAKPGTAGSLGIFAGAVVAALGLSRLRRDSAGDRRISRSEDQAIGPRVPSRVAR